MQKEDTTKINAEDKKYTITVKVAKERYPNELSGLTDEEVQNILNFFYMFSHTIISSKKPNL